MRTELPWADEALLHRTPPWRTSGPSAGEITGRPLPEDVWRLDWLLPPGKDLVTPELLVARIRETLAGWSGGTMGPLNVSPIPPPPFLTPRAVNAAVLGLLARVDTDHRDEILRGFVEMAVKLTEA